MKKITKILLGLFAAITLVSSAAYYGGVYINDGPNLDAFQRLRVSNIFTIFDSKQLSSKDTVLFWSEVTNATGTATFNRTNACVEMAVATTNDYVIRQTRQRFNYQPGKSMLLFLTAVAPTNAGVTTRIGYYNSDTNAPYTNVIDGIYYEVNNNTGYMCIAKSGFETRVPQSSWNIDRLDGSLTNNPTGLTLNKDRDFIFLIDFEWLGVGRVRTGFVIGGQIVYTHQFVAANTNYSVYMSSPNHSVRYEIRSTGGAGILQHICSSVNSEGGVDPNGLTQAIEATNVFQIVTATVNTSLMAIRLSTNDYGSTVIINNVNLSAASLGATEAFRYELVFNPSFTDTYTWVPLANSGIEVASAPNLVSTGGVVMAIGYMSSTEKIANPAVNTSLRLGTSINGTRDVIVLRVTSMGAGGDNITSSLEWRELK